MSRPLKTSKVSLVCLILFLSGISIYSQLLTTEQLSERDRELRAEKYQEEIERLTRIPDDFPYDWVVNEFWINCDKGKYIFKKEGTFIYSYGCIGERVTYDIGNWKLLGDTIIIETDITIGTRHIGEPLNPEYMGAAEPEEYLIYETYVNFETWNYKKTVIIIKDFLHEMCTLSDTEKASQFDLDLNMYKIPGDFKMASCKLLSDTDLNSLDKKQLRLMRNEIFARYGYIFKSDDLRAHFNSKIWYNPKIANADGYLTVTEKRNIKLIKDYEGK